jgi:hypothetical protein
LAAYNNLTQSKKLIYEHIDVATVNMSFTDNLDLQPDFVNDVELLPYLGSSLNASETYTNFINKYGTSYVNRIVLGGRA